MSMIMMDSGHIIHALAMYNQTYHLAWGGLPVGYADPWDINQVPPTANAVLVTETVTRGTVGKLDQLANLGVMSLVSVIQGPTVYTPTSDYTLNGRNVDWTPAGSEPAPGSTYTVVYRYNSTAVTSLLSEIGRRSPTRIGFVNLDSNGDITANNTSWSLSANNGTTPTRNLYLQFKFDGTDAVGSIIYQLGLFIGTVATQATPPAQKYLLPANVSDPGKLYMIENIIPVSRFAGKREIFEFVITY